MTETVAVYQYQHDYKPTHSKKPRYLQNAIDWCEKAYALHRALPDGADPDTVACVVGALVLIEAHKDACYDRWMREQYPPECRCVLPEQSCEVCAPALPEDAPIPF